MNLSLENAEIIADAALAVGRERGLSPLTVAVLDAGRRLPLGLSHRRKVNAVQIDREDTVVRLFFMSLVVIAAAVGSIVPRAAQAEDADREITKIAGDLYRFRNKFHFSVFLVTVEGVIATDPINADAAKWLEAEIDKRFGQPIKYVIYSHDHADHIAGGEVWADTATVVAHENAKWTIIGEKRPTAVPDITFTDGMTIELGGKVVELSYLGRSHSDNLIVMRFPEERALFTVDFISVNRLPYRTLSDAYFPDWIGAIAEVEAMDFDILVPGHGAIGTKADAARHRRYLEALYEGVLAAARQGKTVDQMKQEIGLEDYMDWGQYNAWRVLNIEGMYRHISLHRRGN